MALLLLSNNIPACNSPLLGTSVQIGVKMTLIDKMGPSLMYLEASPSSLTLQVTPAVPEMKGRSPVDRSRCRHKAHVFISTRKAQGIPEPLAFKLGPGFRIWCKLILLMKFA